MKETKLDYEKALYLAKTILRFDKEYDYCATEGMIYTKGWGKPVLNTKDLFGQTYVNSLSRDLSEFYKINTDVCSPCLDKMQEIGELESKFIMEEHHWEDPYIKGE